MLANGAVTFITPIICRRTIPGGIAARGVTELPPLAPLGLDPGAAVEVGCVDRVPAAAFVLGIRGVETRVLGARLLLRGVELGDMLAELERTLERLGVLLAMGLEGELEELVVPVVVPAPVPAPAGAVVLGQLDTVTVVVLAGHAAQSALAIGQRSMVDGSGVTTTGPMVTAQVEAGGEADEDAPPLPLPLPPLPEPPEPDPEEPPLDPELPPPGLPLPLLPEPEEPEPPLSHAAVRSWS